MIDLVRQGTGNTTHDGNLNIIVCVRSQSESDQVDALTKKIDDFLDGKHATPEQVKEVARECLDSTMTMDANQIKDLAEQINAATGDSLNMYLIITDLRRLRQKRGQDQPRNSTAPGLS